MALGSKSRTTNFNSIEIDNNVLSDPKEIANALNNHFCTTAKRIVEESSESRHQQTNAITFESLITKLPKTTNTFHFRKITPNDVKKAIAKQKNSRAGEIPSRFLKDSSACIALPLAVIFSKSLQTGVFPENLKIARISAIFKGKGSRANPDHY